MTLDEFSHALRCLMNDSVDLPAKDVLREIEGAMNVLMREMQFEALGGVDGRESSSQ